MLAVVFVVTGACGLLSEQVFEKFLSTVVGASTPSSAIVLAVYFAGLTLGGFGYGLSPWGRRSPLRLYLVLEASVGLWCLLLAGVLPFALSWSARVVHAAGQEPGAVFLARVAVAAVWILPPTLAMGATFPAMTGVLRERYGSRVQKAMTLFYSLNLLGAILGATLGPYFVFPSLGVGGALVLVFALEALVVAAVAMSMRRARTRPAAAPPKRSVKESLARLKALLLTPAFASLAVMALVSGFVFFAFEVVWTHLIGAVLGNSVYAFGLMLSAVLTGLFVGAWIVARLPLGGAMRSGSPQVIVLALAALAASLSQTLWDDVPDLMLGYGDLMTSFARGELFRGACALVLVGLPSAVIGMVFPLLFRSPGFPEERADEAAGVLCAFNALGCIGGALATGFWLLPALGAEASYRLLVFLLVMASLLRWLPSGGKSAGSHPTAVRALSLALALLALGVTGSPRAWDILALTSGVNTYFQQLHVRPGTELLFVHEDAQGGFTTVVTHGAAPASGSSAPRAGGRKTLLTNGKFQGNNSGESMAQVAFSLIPILHAPRRERALVIGLGTGQSAAVVAAAGYGELEIAELSEGIVAAARSEFANVNRDVLDAPRVRLFLEDGRNHLLRDESLYDLVAIELTSVWFSGATNLYSREFYQLVSSRLAADGVFQQWIQFHHIAPREVASVVRTLRNVFEHVNLWYLGGQGILVASHAQLTIMPDTQDRLRARPEMQRYFELVAQGGDDLSDLSRHLLLDAGEVDELMRRADELGIPLNTDRNRFLEYSTPRHNLERKDHRTEVLIALLEFVVKDQRASRFQAVLGLPPSAHPAAQVHEEPR